jgi:hypothetical protein
MLPVQTPRSRPHPRPGTRTNRRKRYQPTPPPVSPVTVATNAASYVLAPDGTMTVTIADAASTSGGTTHYTLEVSYNSPGSGDGLWYPGPTTLTRGDTVIHLMGQLPFSRTSPHCRLRAVNNDTGAAGVSNGFALTAE